MGFLLLLICWFRQNPDGWQFGLIIGRVGDDVNEGRSFIRLSVIASWSRRSRMNGIGMNQDAVRHPLSLLCLSVCLSVCLPVFLSLTLQRWRTEPGFNVSTEDTMKDVKAEQLIRDQAVYPHSVPIPVEEVVQACILCTCKYAYVCIHACAYVLAYVCMLVCMYVLCMYECMHVHMYECKYVCMCVRMYVCMHVSMQVYMYDCMYGFMYICIKFYVYVPIQECIHESTFLYTYLLVCVSLPNTSSRHVFYRVLP